MRQTSKNSQSSSEKQNAKVNTSLEDPLTCCHSNKTSLNMNTFYQSLQCSQSKKSPRNSVYNNYIINQPTTESFFRPQFTNGMLIIPEVTKSISQYIQSSKISCQLNDISAGFNKENRRLQEILFQIRQSTEKKQKQRQLNSLSQFKKIHWTKIHRNSKNNFITNQINMVGWSKQSYKADKTLKIDKKIKQKIDFNNQCTKTLTNFIKYKKYPDRIHSKFKKQKNISELMRQQRLLLFDMKVNKIIL